MQVCCLLPPVGAAGAAGAVGAAPGEVCAVHSSPLRSWKWVEGLGLRVHRLQNLLLTAASFPTLFLLLLPLVLQRQTIMLRSYQKRQQYEEKGHQRGMGLVQPDADFTPST
jgi:hypothetical protein